MVDWFLTLNPGEQITFASLVFTVVVALIAGGWKLYIHFSNRPEKNNENTQDNRKSKGNNTQINIKDSTVTIQQDNKKIGKIYNMLKAQQTVQSFDANTEQQLKAVLAKFIKSNDQDKQQAVKELKSGNIAKAAEILETIYTKQRQIIKQQHQQIAKNTETTLELATIYWFSQPERAFSLLQLAVKQSPDNINAQNQLGILAMRFGKMQLAINAFKQILSLAGSSKQAQVAALGNLGLAYADLGKVDKAIEYYQQALVIAREIKDRQGEGNRLGNLGSAYADLGKVDKAIEYYLQAMKIFREIKDRSGEGGILVI